MYHVQSKARHATSAKSIGHAQPVAKHVLFSSYMLAWMANTPGAEQHCAVATAIPSVATVGCSPCTIQSMSAPSGSACPSKWGHLNTFDVSSEMLGKIDLILPCSLQSASI